jgi:hypothetical protein
MNHHCDLRIRTSLQRHVGESATDLAEIERLARRARESFGVVVFLPGDLDRMDAIARRFIEGEHKRICEKGR